jgi:hypothetical protein
MVRQAHNEAGFGASIRAWLIRCYGLHAVSLDSRPKGGYDNEAGWGAREV